MARPPEVEPPRPKEPPKSSEKGTSAKGRKDTAIEEAKKTIQDVTSKDDAVRLEAIQKLRNPPLESLDAAKATLKATPVGEVSWLISSADDIRYSPELAVFAAKLAGEGELRNDPRWLLAQTVELAYSVRADATPEARREINTAVRKVGGRLQELMQTQAYEGVTTASFDEAMYGSSMNTPILSAEKNIFDEEKPGDETITDPELIRLLREINNKLYTDSEYLDDPKNLRNDVTRLQNLADKRGVSRMQVKEAIDRLNEIKTKVSGKSEANVDIHGREIIKYEDIRDSIPPEDQVEGRGEFTFSHLSHDNIAKLRRGEDGARECFYEFITDIYSMGRTPERPNLWEESEHKEFMDFIKWAHPKNTDYYAQQYDYIWKEMSKHNQIVKNLLYTPGDIKEKLKSLQFLTPADLDHYSKNIKYAHYAQSLYDEAVMDLLSERKVKYLDALSKLRQGKDWTAPFDRYKELADLRKAGRLESPALEREFQDLQEIIDTVGYGVNLWDSDIQNYTELDLQIGELNKELDALKIKGDSGDKERMELLESEIKYKNKMMKRVQTEEDYNSEKIRQGLHQNKGLSKLDIDVKERLRLLLKERDPEAKVHEWELNMAVWAARQWEIGSSHLVSVSSGMATRPAFEFKHIAEKAGIDVGKYVMKAPAFEDLQRVIDPELFQDRFGMGDVVGETFRAITDRSLMERKGYKFKNDPKYRRDDEKGMDRTLRETREFIRQIQEEQGIQYSEMITQGIFQAGGVYDKTGWRLQIATLEEMRKKYLEMQKNGLLPENAQLDNQGLGIQFLSGKNAAGKKELLKRMVERDPSKLYFFLNREFDNILSRGGFSEVERHKFRQALSVAHIKTWDTKQKGENRKLAFQSVDLTKKEHFDRLIRPILKQQGFSEDQAGSLLSALGDAKTLFDNKAKGFAEHEWPFTLSINDVDWSDASMFQTGNIANDRRGRDMYGMAMARDIWNQMSSDPELLFAKDPKDTLKKLKEMRTFINSYTTGENAEKAMYEVAKAWLNMNRNRMIHNDLPFSDIFKNPVGFAREAAKTVLTYIPGVQNGVKYLSELDTSGGWLAKGATLKIGKWEPFGEAGKKWAERLEKKPRELSQNISYGVRFTGPHGNAFNEKELDEILSQMLQMGVFNSDEKLYHSLRKEMKASLGFQLVGLIRKYWWLLPLLTAWQGAKEGVDEEKKR